MKIPNPESCSGGNPISEIEGWYTERPRPLLVISLLIMLSLVVMSYFANNWWVEHFPSTLVLSFVIIMTSALLAGVAKQRVAYGWEAPTATILVFTGLGMLLGTFLSASRDLSFGAGPIFVMAGLVVVALLVETKLRARLEVLEIIVKDDYSLLLIRHLASKTKEVLDQNGLRYRNEGTGFDIQMGPAGRILVALHMSVRRHRTVYKISLVDKGIEDTSIIDELEDKISSMVLDVEQESDFDSFPKIDRILCNKCSGETIYLMISDEIYCRHCRMKRGDDEVTIMYSTLSGWS
jgi:hypothetical protein